jgi:hypothetical protein
LLNERIRRNLMPHTLGDGGCTSPVEVTKKSDQLTV